MLLGIVGKKRSGKNSIADYLQSHHDFEIYSFAKPLKDACKLLFDFSEEQLEGNLKEVVDPRYDTTPRKIMQVFGTELFQYALPKNIPELEKKVGRGFWVYKFEQWYENKLIHNKNLNVVVPDVRFIHEIEAIKKYDGIIWRVLRTQDNLDNHASENECDNYLADVRIVNNYSILELHKNIEESLKQKALIRK